MERVEVTTNTLAEVSAASDVDLLLQVASGSGYLCLGDDDGVTLDECFSVSQGSFSYLFVPAGIDLHAAKSGTAPLVLILAPFSVAA